MFFLVLTGATESNQLKDHDTALISLLSNSGDPGLRRHGVVEPSDNNALENNTKKTGDFIWFTISLS